MSQYVSVEYLEGQLRIHDADVQRFCLLDDQLPEVAFVFCQEECFGPIDEEGYRAILKPWWYGEGSAYTLDLLREILRSTQGSADLVVVREGSPIRETDGYRVVDGTLSEHAVRITLEHIVLDVPPAVPPL